MIFGIQLLQTTERTAGLGTHIFSVGKKKGRATLWSTGPKAGRAPITHTPRYGSQRQPLCHEPQGSQDVKLVMGKAARKVRNGVSREILVMGASRPRAERATGHNSVKEPRRKASFQWGFLPPQVKETSGRFATSQLSKKEHHLPITSFIKTSFILPT